MTVKLELNMMRKPAPAFGFHQILFLHKAGITKGQVADNEKAGAVVRSFVVTHANTRQSISKLTAARR